MIWKIAKLGDICKIQTGNSIPVKEKKVLYKNIDEGLPYVATKDVGFDGVINYDNGVRIPPIHSSKFKLSKKNSILVCGEGGSAGRKIAFSNKDCYFVNKLFSICSVTETVPKYVYYYALSNEFQNQFKNAMNGLIGGVSLSKIRDFQITYPSISEQQRIIAKLDAAFAEIDKTIYTDEQKLLKINLLKQTLLKFEFNIDAEKTKLGEVVKYDKQNGQGSKLPYIGMENISKETMRILGKIKVPEKTSSTFKFNNSHVLFGRLRPYLKNS